MPIRTGSAQADLAAFVDLVRDYAHCEGLAFYSRSEPTRDGRVTVDYVPNVGVRVTLTGDAPARSYTLPASWPR